MFFIFDLLLPPIVLVGSIATLPFTVLYLTATGQVADLTNTQKFRHSWFQAFWTWFGPSTKFIFAPKVRPLLAQAKGTVLDLGPGNGVWMKELGLAYKNSNGGIKKIYGVEPNTLFHAELLRKAKAAGLEGVYQPVGTLVQDLESVGVEKGSIDTVITVHVLCSVGGTGNTKEIIQSLYEFLRPGGTWLVFEHVASQHAPTRAWQYVNNLIWPGLLDGCDLTKNTGDLLKSAAGWETCAIGPDSTDGYFEGLPHVVGTLIK